MTREEAISYFKEHNEVLVSVAKDENVYDYEKQVIEADCMRRSFEANEMAIKSLEQEPCEDDISRQEVVSADDWKELMECIISLPSVTSYPKIER